MKTPHARAVEAAARARENIYDNYGGIIGVRCPRQETVVAIISDYLSTMKAEGFTMQPTTDCPHCSGSRILHGCVKESCDCDNAGGYGCAPVACGECGEVV